MCTKIKTTEDKLHGENVEPKDEKLINKHLESKSPEDKGVERSKSQEELKLPLESAHSKNLEDKLEKPSDRNVDDRPLERIQDESGSDKSNHKKKSRFTVKTVAKEEEKDKLEASGAVVTNGHPVTATVPVSASSIPPSITTSSIDIITSQLSPVPPPPPSHTGMSPSLPSLVSSSISTTTTTSEPLHPSATISMEYLRHVLEMNTQVTYFITILFTSLNSLSLHN